MRGRSEVLIVMARNDYNFSNFNIIGPKNQTIADCWPNIGRAPGDCPESLAMMAASLPGAARLA